MKDSIAAVLVHVANVDDGLTWYRRAFPNAELRYLEDIKFSFLKIGAISLEIVLADEKVASGAAGSVVYWRVEDLDSSLARFKELGAILFRGPLQIEDALFMCQVLDPWGNCIGLRGPAPSR